MSIRIYNDGLAGAAAPETSRAQELSRTSGSGKAHTGQTGGTDDVQISSLSQSLATQSTQRAARVQQLAALYQSGNYQVNSMDVSQAIVNHALSGSSEIEP